MNFFSTTKHNLAALDPQKFYALLDIICAYINRHPYSNKTLICPLALIYPQALVHDFVVTNCNDKYDQLNRYLNIFRDIRTQVLKTDYLSYLQTHYKGSACLRQLEKNDIVFIENKAKIGQGSLMFGKIIQSVGSDYILQDFHNNVFHVAKIRCHPYIPFNPTFHVSALPYK